MKNLRLTLTLLDVVPTLAFAEQSAPSQLNEILAGEVSAVETYNQALEKIGKNPEASTLVEINRNHLAAVTKLQNLVGKAGGKADTDSGFWGVYAKTVMGSAKILGDKTALKALKEGEEHGLKEYQEVLENKNVSPEAKSFVKDVAIPAQRQHITTLDQMMAKL